jgi:hypothetical protein
VFADLRKLQSAKKLGSAIRKIHKSANHKTATLSEDQQICGFAICGTYLRTAHLICPMEFVFQWRALDQCGDCENVWAEGCPNCVRKVWLGVMVFLN